MTHRNIEGGGTSRRTRHAGKVISALRDPVVWVLLAAGTAELLSGGTAARGSILFAGAFLVLVDHVRRHVAPERSVPWNERWRPSASTLRSAVVSPRWLLVAAVGAVAVALPGVHTKPLTAVVVVIGAAILGWAWVTMPDAVPVAQPGKGTLATWGMLLVALAAWELVALLGQPSLSVGSYDRPTLSFLLDPIVTTYPGRLAGLLVWLLAGRGLVRRA